MFMSGSYLAFIVLTMVIGLGAQWYVNRQISKFSRVRSSFGMTGAQMAQRMLADHGITNVAIRQGGAGQDHFDATIPSRSTLKPTTARASRRSPRRVTKRVMPASSRRAIHP